jgi:hypothetical protein
LSNPVPVSELYTKVRESLDSQLTKVDVEDSVADLVAKNKLAISGDFNLHKL